jgi:raffinose/stachyose/melibiose transport system permease protein
MTSTTLEGTRASATVASKTQRRRPGESGRAPYLYLVPGLVAYTLFAVIPILHTGVLSFFEWDGLTDPTWVGIDNYLNLVNDPVLQGALIHSVIYIFFYAFLPIVIGLLLVTAMTRTRIRGLPAFRTLLFLPYTLALVVVAVSWRWMFESAGSIDSLLTAVGLESLIRPWLGDFFWALPAVGVMGAWAWYGLAMVLFLAGAQRIPRDLYDAARADGAGVISEFLAVTLPGLRYEISVTLTLTVIFALRNFDLVWVTTKGGPGYSTTTPALLMYQDAFQSGQVGLGAALGVMITVLILVTAVVIQRWFERG